MPSLSESLSRVKPIIDVVRPYGRAGAAFIAGLTITFVQDHSYSIGLGGMLFVVAVSLLVHDGPKTALNTFTWYVSLTVFLIALLGLMLGKMSSSGTLSLIMALAAFETVLAIARADRLWAWATAVLVAALSVIYFTVPTESPMPAGLTGAWAIVAGVFEIIAVFDMHVKFARTTVGGKVTAAAKSSAQATVRGAQATRRGVMRLGKATTRGSKR